jgi:hypothetical protein
LASRIPVVERVPLRVLTYRPTPEPSPGAVLVAAFGSHI